jgi:aspartate/methionine/tyrosine aminotransferase
MTNLQLSAAITRVQPSGIRAIAGRARQIPDCLHLEFGEPDHPTPEHIVDAAVAAMRAGHTRYTPSNGIAELRQELADKASYRNGLQATAESVYVTAGAVEGLYACVRAVTDPGDEVLVPDPGWPNNLAITQVAGASAVPYQMHARDDYAITADAVRRALTPRTRAVIVNSPSNPLGVVAARHEWLALIELAKARGFWLISDECYDELVFTGTSLSPASLDPTAPVLSVFSFSKTYAMTGWRVGYVIVPEASHEGTRTEGPGGAGRAIGAIQESIISCLNAPSQFAALAALRGPQDAVTMMRESYRLRRDSALRVLNDCGVRALRPAGAFYLWVDIGPSRLSSAQFAHDLLEEAAVAAVPGSAFGAQGEGWLRVSLAADEATLVLGLQRICERLGA